MDRFFAGDRVVAISGSDGNLNIVGKIGTVIYDKDPTKPGVEYDEYIGGHDLGGKCREGHGWYTYTNDLEYYYEPTPAPSPETMEISYEELIS